LSAAVLGAPTDFETVILAAKPNDQVSRDERLVVFDQPHEIISSMYPDAVMLISDAAGTSR
jgi:hypothetical protein